MLTGEIPFLSKGLQDEVRQKYEGHIVFAVGTSDYYGIDYFVVSTEDGGWLYIMGDHTPDQWAEYKSNKLTAEQLLEFLQNNNEIAKSWMDFRDDNTGNRKHTGPSYMGLIGMLKYDLGKEE